MLQPDGHCHRHTLCGPDGLARVLFCSLLLLLSRPALPPCAGVTPFWPAALAALTGFSDDEGSELSLDCTQVSATLTAAGLPGFD